MDLASLGRSPIRVEKLLKILENYDNVNDANILSEGFRAGFKIKYKDPREARESRNLKSAIVNKEALLENLNREISLGRIAGPFTSCPTPNLIVSPVGLVPKSDGDGV